MEEALYHRNGVYVGVMAILPYCSFCIEDSGNLWVVISGLFGSYRENPNSIANNWHLVLKRPNFYLCGEESVCKISEQRKTGYYQNTVMLEYIQNNWKLSQQNDFLEFHLYLFRDFHLFLLCSCIIPFYFSYSELNIPQNFFVMQNRA